MSKPVYVIGHRNPDTDAICSAIAYAHLKNEMGIDAIPARAGKINSETKFVLDYFNVKPPMFIDDLYPRVKDVMTKKATTIESGNNLRALGKLMKEHQTRSVPVVKEGNKLVGIVSVADLANRYFEELEMEDLSTAGVTFENILNVLDGELVYGKNLDRKVKSNVKIAAARTHTMLERIQEGEVILAADRIQAHMAAIDKKASCLIVSGNCDIDPTVIEAAQKTDIIIIRSHCDTYTCARLINQSLPVDTLMQKELISFKPTDLISDITKTIVKTNHRNYPVVENERLVGLIRRDKLIMQEKTKVILVDHNEHTQAVEGVEEAKILEIVDHHRLGGLQTGEPIFIRHEPVGSTATIVANMHWHRNIPIPKTIAGLLLSAIVSDTILFKSPTATQTDKETAEKLAKIIELDLETFGMEVLKAGAAMENKSPTEVVHNDLKEFNMAGKLIAIGQISVMAPENILKKKNNILEYMEKLQREEHYDMSILLVTDIINTSTYLIYTNEAYTLIKEGFDTEGCENMVFLEGVMSRKKQVVPPLVEASKK